MNAVVVVTTVGTEEEANSLASELVSRRLAACVNVLPVQRSIYRWKGKLCEDSELMLLIKSVAAEYPALEAAIKELHSYDLPEILCFHVREGEAGFLSWLAEATDKEPSPSDDAP
ncbi:MAG: divalent-cation tolerance protein CutA [Thermoanaerobaculia bacterium]